MGELHTAARNGNIVEIKKLIANGSDVNKKDTAGWAPLHHAADKGHHAAIEAF